MSDTARHDATRRDDVHTLSLRELEALIAQAGIVISRRQIMRHCKSGTFDAIKIPARNNIEEWFIAPGCVEKGVADIRALRQLRERHDATRRHMSQTDEQKNTQRDAFGHDATRPDMTETEREAINTPTQPATSRYVAQLEKRIEEKDEVIGLLKTELTNRNEEIVRRNERERETNVLIRGLQNLVLRLQAPVAPAADVLDGDVEMANSESREVPDQHLSPHQP